MTDSFEDEVHAVYEWVDQQVAAAQPVCEISGRCCRFRNYGHKLFLTAIEAEILFRKKLPAVHDNPEATTPEAVNQACPYQENGLCTAREHRPLGCRIFFCDPNFDQRCCEITEEAIERLKRLHDKHERPWVYRDLASFFA